MKKKLYIAYGSNINLEQMAYRCPNSDIVGTSIIKGYELQFKGFATIAENENAETPVLVWLVPQQDEKRLDRYEGYPNLYRKENLEVKIGGESCEAMVYIMNGDRPLHMPSLEYYNCIELGYLKNGMDTDCLVQALRNSVLSQELEINDDQQMSL